MRPAVRKLGPMCVQTRGAGGELEVAPMPAFTVGGPVMKRAPPPPRPAPPADLPAAVPTPAALPSSQPKQKQQQAAPRAADALTAGAAAPAAAQAAEQQRKDDDAVPAAETQPGSAARGPAEPGAQPAPAAVVSGAGEQDAREASDVAAGPAGEAAVVAPAAPAVCASGSSAETADAELPGHAGGAAAMATAGLGQPLQPAEASVAAGDAAVSFKAAAQQSASDLPSPRTIGGSVPIAAAPAPAGGMDVTPQLGSTTAPDAYLATAAATEAGPVTYSVSQPSRPDSGVAAGTSDGAHTRTGVRPTVALGPTASAGGHGAPLYTASASALSAAQPAMSPLPTPSGWDGGRDASEMAIAAQRAAFEAALGMALGPEISTFPQRQPIGVAVPLRGPAVRRPTVVPPPPQLVQAQLLLQVPAPQHGAVDAAGGLPSDPVAMFLNDGPDK